MTRRYVYGDTFAHNTVFRHAMERHIPVLPILEEGGIERDFDKKCGNLQYLDPFCRDIAIWYDEFLVPGEDFNDAIRAGKVYHELLKADRVLDAAYHAGWTRRNLFVSYDRLGKIREEQGDLAGARAFYEKSLAISERLAAQCPGVRSFAEHLAIVRRYLR